MYAVLFRIGSHEVHAYAFALTLAFASGIALACVRARRQALDPRVVIDASIVIILAALVGSRSMGGFATQGLSPTAGGSWAPLLNPFARDGTRLVGLSVTGGLPLAAAAALFLLAWRRVPVLVYADLLAPSVALGEAITRLGCFLNGCCHGPYATGPGAYTFRRAASPRGLSPASRFIPRSSTLR